MTRLNVQQVQRKPAIKLTIDAIDPLDFLAAKTRPTPEAANDMALATLIHLDATKRGFGYPAAENALVRLVVMAQVIGSKSGNKTFYAIAIEAGNQLLHACKRESPMLTLTTGEYKAVRAMVNAYLSIFPTTQIALLIHAAKQADHLIRHSMTDPA